MIYFTDKEIDDLLIEDVPFIDITTSLLKLENKPAKIQFFTLENTVVCCTEEVMKIFNKVGIQTTLFTPSGEYIEKGIKFMEGEGLTKNIQAVMKVCENLMTFASGIATRTRVLSDKIKEINPEIILTTSRKTIPFTKKIALKAVLAGGATIQRMGLSDSILIFDNHVSFLGGLECLEKRLKERKHLSGGRPIVVEVKSLEEARKVIHAGVDIIQLNQMVPQQIKTFKKELKASAANIKLAVSNNINPDTVEDYCKSGADILITSWPYFGKPSELMMTVTPIFDVY